MRKHLGSGLTLALVLFFSVQVSAQTTGRIQAEGLFVEAQKALARGDDGIAEELLMKALQKDGSFTSAIWQLSQIYEKRGKFEYSRELLIRGLQQEPQAAWAREKLSQLEMVLTRKLLTEAESYMGTGQYKRAIPKLSLYLGIKPYDPTPLIMLGRCHLALGNLSTSKEYVEQAIERDPSNGQAASLFNEIVERLGKNSLIYLIGQAEKVLSDYTPTRKAEAREALEAVLARDPENTWAREKLGELELLATVGEEIKNEGNKVAGKCLEVVKNLKQPAARVIDFVLGNLLIAILAIVAVLLAVNLKRRAERKSYPLQGSLSLIPILDIVSLINSNLKTGHLILSSGKTRGEIYFEKGEIVHARWRGFDGKKAFHLLMDLNSGAYSFNNHLPNVRHTISEPLSLLLLSMKSPERPKPAAKPGSRPEREQKTKINPENLFSTLPE